MAPGDSEGSGSGGVIGFNVRLLRACKLSMSAVDTGSRE